MQKRRALVWAAVSASFLVSAMAATSEGAIGGASERAAHAAVQFVRSHQRSNEKEFLAPWTKEPNWKKRGSFFTVLTPFAKLCLLVRNESMGGQMPSHAEIVQLAEQLQREGITVVARFPTITRKGDWGGWRHDEYRASLTMSNGRKSLALKPWQSSTKRDLSFRTSSWDQRYWRDFATKEYQFAIPMVKLPPRLTLTFRVGDMWAQFAFPAGEFLR